MALAFPILLDGFWRALPIQGGTWELGEAVEMLTLGGGEVLASEHGTRLWRGTAEMTALQQWERDDVMAQLRPVQRPNGSFFCSPLHAERPGPATCLLNGVQNGRELRLSGLPAGTAVARRAYLSWSYGANPVRWAFHQLAEPLLANASGVTGWAEVSPDIRPGWVLGATVQLAVPRLKAVIVPKSLRPARSRKSVAEGLAFDWMQTLR